MKNQLGQLGNPLEIRKIRKNLARINTAMVQKIAR
jgi:large subunit ribosomal protein L29